MELPLKHARDVYDLWGKWKLGLGMLNYFGLAEEYGDGTFRPAFARFGL